MTSRHRSRKKSGRGKSRSPQPLEFWKVVPEPDRSEPINAVDDPGAIIRSLGSPPFGPHTTEAARFLELASRKAAATAAALANAAGLVEAPDDSDE